MFQSNSLKQLKTGNPNSPCGYMFGRVYYGKDFGGFWVLFSRQRKRRPEN